MADDPEQPEHPQDAPVSPHEDDSEVEVGIDYKLKATSGEDAIARPIKTIYDDFSLTSGSASGVRFRNHNNIREFKIYDQMNAQLILEEVEDRDDEEGDEEGQKAGRGIRIKQTSDTSYGLQFLR
jgi:hypothetical protein